MAKNLWMQRFDPKRNFVARRPFSMLGSRLNAGDPIDKDSLTDRRLRQMYDHRLIITEEAYSLHTGVGKGGRNPSPGDNPTGDPANASPGPSPADGGASEPEQLDLLAEGEVETEVKDETNPEAEVEAEAEVKDEPHPNDSVEIPEGWKSLLADGMKGLAKKLGESVGTKWEAEAVIEKELKRRGQLS